MHGGRERPGGDAAATGTGPGREVPRVLPSLPSITASYGLTQAETSPFQGLAYAGWGSEGKQAQNGHVLQNDPPGQTLTLPELSRSRQGCRSENITLNE